MGECSIPCLKKTLAKSRLSFSLTSTDQERPSLLSRCQRSPARQMRHLTPLRALS